MKKTVFFFILLFVLSFAGWAANFETKVLTDYQEYISTFDRYMNVFEKTGKLDVKPSDTVQNVVYTIVNELEPAAYYRWIRIRSFHIPSGAVGNFPNINMQYIAKNIYDRYKTDDAIENVSLSAFLVYVVGTLYRENIGQTDFPRSPTFTETVFTLNTKVSNEAAKITQSYLQKAIGAQGNVLGSYTYKHVDLKDLLLTAVKKAYDGKVPQEVEKAIQNANITVPPVMKIKNGSVVQLALDALTQDDVNAAIDKFESNLSKAFGNTARMIKLFASNGKATDAVKRALGSLGTTFMVQEMISSNVVKRNVSKSFNNRMFRLEKQLASVSSKPHSLLFWRWLLYAIALIVVAIFAPKALKFTLFAVLVTEGTILLFNVDPMLNRFDSTMYGFLIVTTAFLAILSWIHVFTTKKWLFIASSTAVVVLFFAMLFVPLYSNLPSTRMSKNKVFMNSVYLKLYEGELYGANGILTYHLSNLDSNLVSLRADSYNFTSQTLSSYLTSVKKAGAFKGIIQYPSALRINVDRNSPFFGYKNVDKSMKDIQIVQERAQSVLDDIKSRLNLMKIQEETFAQTLDGIYRFAAPALRTNIDKDLKKQISSSALAEISSELGTTMKKADMMPEMAPKVHFFQTREGSKLFVLVSLLLLSVTFFARIWVYRFAIAILTILGGVFTLGPKSVEFFVEYGFPTYSHILSRGESSNHFMLWVTVIIGVFVAFEALYTRFFETKQSH